MADTDNARIRRVGADGVVSTFAGNGEQVELDGDRLSAGFAGPSGLALAPAGDLYVADTDGQVLRRISGTTVSTLAGQAGSPGWTDASGSAARFNAPVGVACGPGDDLFVADSGNHRIRRVTPAGVVSTFAGSGVDGFADGAGASARFSFPQYVAVTADGTVYVADSSNRVIRRISPAGVVSTMAGTGQTGRNDGAGGTATFSDLGGIAVDPAGHVFVADSSNDVIRRIAPDGTVSTLAGTGTAGFVDGSLLTASFDFPWGLALDSLGRLYVGDGLNGAVRRLE